MIVGIVGKPSCGKSTFFKAATLAEVEIANYPFTTIKPNHGVGYVSTPCADQFFKVQCNPRFGHCSSHQRFIPIDMLDVAGLVPGAHEGKGMGNQFLDDLRQADVLVHVIDVAGATNANGEPVDVGSYDPLNDVQFLEDELDFWYRGILIKGWEKCSKESQQTKVPIQKTLGKQLSGLGVNEDMVKEEMAKLRLDADQPTRWTEQQLFQLSQDLRKRTKPMIVACNKIDLPGAANNFTRIKEKFPHHTFIACSAESELALKEAQKHGMVEYIPGSSGFKIIQPERLNEKQVNALNFIKENILAPFGSTGVQHTLNQAVFSVLKYIAIFPGGVNKLADSEGRVLPDCFLLKSGSTALDFAYKLHTDLGDNFIRAIDVKTKRTVGKEHLLNNGDVVEIVANK